MRRVASYFLILAILLFPASGLAWHDETHISIAKAAGYKKWYNSAGADMIKIKAGGIEKRNHYVNNQPGTIVTPEMVLEQAILYNSLSNDMAMSEGEICVNPGSYAPERRITAMDL